MAPLWGRFWEYKVLASSSDNVLAYTGYAPDRYLCKLLLSSVEYAVPICIMIVMCKCYSK